MISSEMASTAIQDLPAQSILVIDDEESMRHMLSVILQRAGYRVYTAADGEAGLELLAQETQLAIVLCDVRMPRLDGLGFLKRLHEITRPIYTVMMSAYGSMELAIEAMKNGASDYVSKPFKADEILLVLKKLEERERLTRENDLLRAAIGPVGSSSQFVGASDSVRELLATAQQFAGVSSTVLLRGESGTGKEVLARLIHDWSPRSERAFVAINCAAIPENLLESELFGHVRGAFTGAVRAKKGLFEQADNGTLLLDEIGDMPVGLQAKLLRVLETQVLRPVGGSAEKTVDVRVIAATAKDLDAAVASGDFRQDLFYRLNVLHLRIPPLRERSEDIPLLVDHFLAVHSARMGRPLPRVSPEAFQEMLASSWRGNVRELQNVVERAVVLAKNGVVTLNDLPPTLLAVSEVVEDGALSIKIRLPRLEKQLIERALKRCRGNRSQAARVLDISYKALLYKIRDYELESE